MDWLTFEEAREWANKQEDIRTAEDWFEWDTPKDIPRNPQLVYGDKWKGWHDWLGKEKKVWMPFDEAREWAIASGIVSMRAWYEAKANGDMPENIPRNPHRVYGDEWVNWYDWLGQEVPKSLDELYPDVAKEWHPTKNKGRTADDVTPKSGRKVWWKCSNSKCGAEWTARVAGRSSGRGCPYCRGIEILDIPPNGREINNLLKGGLLTPENNLAVCNPELAAEWHPTKNGDLTPYDVTPNSGKKVWWLCENGHECDAVIDNRSKSCPYCSKRKRTA